MGIVTQKQFMLQRAPGYHLGVHLSPLVHVMGEVYWCTRLEHVVV